VASKVGWWYSLSGVDRERVLRGKSVQGDLFVTGSWLIADWIDRL